MNLSLLCSIFLGGGLGALSRFGLSHILSGLLGYALYISILAVNLTGAALAGWLKGAYHLTHSSWQAFLMIGFLASFTTFSTFCAESLSLLEKRGALVAGAYILGTNILGLLAFYKAYKLAEGL